MTSYLSQNEARNLQNGDIHIAQIPDFEMEYLENHLVHWCQWWFVFFCIIHALSCELNFFRLEVPFNYEVQPYYYLGTYFGTNPLLTAAEEYM